MADIADIEGIGPIYADKLRAAGAGTTDALLELAGTREGREALAGETGIPDVRILEWVNHADLFRIKGVGSEYADLLEAGGVDSVPELAHRNTGSLHKRLVAVNQRRRLVRSVPTESQIGSWVEQAKHLERAVHH